jgi:excisionase family DNA binding protein
MSREKAPDIGANDHGNHPLRASRSPFDRFPAQKTAILPRLSVNIDEAAAMLGVSRDFFDEHVRHELRIVRRGRLKLVPVVELERWLDRSASRVLGDRG